MGYALRLSRLPPLRRVHPWTRPESTDMRWLPINRDSEAPRGVPLPPSMLDRWLDEASHRMILDHRGCRKASGCGDYPVKTGCLLMGDAAPRAAPSISREVGAEAAREHARRSMRAGLVPAAATARVDNLIFKVEYPRRMFKTVCFCCECCCLVRYPGHLPLKRGRVFRVGRAGRWLYRRQVFSPEFTADP